jgi:hypothetical protein
VASEKIASIQGEFIIEFAKSPGGEPLVSGDRLIYLDGKATERLNAPKQWIHSFRSADKQVFLDLNQYYSETAIPKVWIRYGVVAGGQGKMSDWEQHTIVKIDAVPDRTADTDRGDLLTMVTSDLLYVMQKDQRIASRKGRISSMAQTIASAAGFKKFAVEPSDLDYALIQSFETDFNFLTSRLIPMATNREGSSGYIMFARGEFFHFHTINYQLSGFFEVDNGILTNTSVDLGLSTRGNDNSLLQTNGMKLVAYDPLTGSTTNWETKPEREIMLSDSAPTRAGVSYQKGHVGQNQLASLYAESQWQYVSDKNLSYNLSFSIDNFPYVSIGDVISSSIVRGQGDQWEGLYIVSSVNHVIASSRILTRYTLMRGEYVSPTGSNVNGKRLTPAGISASSITSSTSGGFHVGAGSVVEVNDPNR